jgi:hypothetical protein
MASAADATSFGETDSAEPAFLASILVIAYLFPLFMISLICQRQPEECQKY